MSQSVYQGGGQHGIWEDIRPVRKLKVGGDYDTATLIAFGQDMEQQFRLLSGKTQVGKLIQDKQVQLSQAFSSFSRLLSC